jgi:hypothetical protein
MPTDWGDDDYDEDDPLRFYVGLRNGCLVSVPLWGLIISAVCFSFGCCHVWS